MTRLVRTAAIVIACALLVLGAAVYSKDRNKEQAPAAQAIQSAAQQSASAGKVGAAVTTKIAPLDAKVPVPFGKIDGLAVNLDLKSLAMKPLALPAMNVATPSFNLVAPVPNLGISLAMPAISGPPAGFGGATPPAGIPPGFGPPPGFGSPPGFGP